MKNVHMIMISGIFYWSINKKEWQYQGPKGKKGSVYCLQLRWMISIVEKLEILSITVLTRSKRGMILDRGRAHWSLLVIRSLVSCKHLIFLFGAIFNYQYHGNVHLFSQTLKGLIAFEFYFQTSNRYKWPKGTFTSCSKHILPFLIPFRGQNS